MKKYEINLISDRKQTKTQQQKAFKVVRVLTILSVVLLVISFGITFFIKSSLANSGLAQQEQTELQQLNALHQKLVTISLVSNRMETINTILQSRAKYDVPIGIILASAPNDISFTAFGVDKKQITFTISSNSLQSIDTFFGNLSNLVANKKNFKIVTLQSLTTNSQTTGVQNAGQYSASLAVQQL